MLTAGHALNGTGAELGRCAKGTFRQARLEEAQETMGRFDCQGGTLNMLPRLAAFQMSVPFITAEGSRARPGISQYVPLTPTTTQTRRSKSSYQHDDVTDIRTVTDS